jgi:ABC-type Zn2+ transport system substrate-binding protein/surface adhesin
VFERLQKDKRGVPKGTIKITIEMPAGYTGIKMPRDLLVRDDDELERIAQEEENDDDDDDHHDDESDDELSDLEDEMFAGPEMWYLTTTGTRKQREAMERKKEAERKEEARRKKEAERQKLWEKEQAENAPEQAAYLAAKARGEEVDVE